jgi:hypothetical protein
MDSCNICYKIFKSKKGLSNHISKKICLNNKHKCEHCKSTFKFKNNYYRHKKHSCSVLIKNKELLTQLLEKDKLLLEQDKLISELKQENKGITNNQINGNQINNNITINNYGCEDINITKEEWIKLANYNIITNLVRLSHIEKESNRNICIKDEKSNKALKMEKNKWIIVRKAELLDDLFHNQIDLASNSLDIHDFTKVLTNDKFGNIHNKINYIIDDISNDKDKERENKDNIEILLLNNKELLNVT